MLALTLLGQFEQLANPVDLMAPSQMAQEARLVREAIETLHPGATRFLSQRGLINAGRELEREAVYAGDVTTWYRAISTYTARLRCDHTKAEWPQKVVDYRESEPTHLPFRFDIVRGQAMITEVPEGSPVKVGDTVLEIEGRRVADLRTTIAKWTAVDGRTDYVKSTKFGDDPDLMGSELDNFGPCIWGLRTKFRVRFRDAGERVLNGLRFSDFEKLCPRPDFADAVSVTQEPGNVTVLRIDSFINYRTPKDPAEVFRPIFADLKSRPGAQLVLDLRRCGGGSDEVPIALLRFLCATPPAWATSVWQTRLGAPENLLPYLNTYDPNLRNPKPADYVQRKDGTFTFKPEARPDLLQAPKAEPEHFDGPVDVLISPHNVSAATLFLARLRIARKIRYIGEPTGGSAAGVNGGTMWFLKLPYSGIVVRIPVRRTETGYPGRADQGIRPDLRERPKNGSVSSRHA